MALDQHPPRRRSFSALRNLRLGEAKGDIHMFATVAAELETLRLARLPLERIWL